MNGQIIANTTYFELEGLLEDYQISTSFSKTLCQLVFKIKPKSKKSKVNLSDKKKLSTEKRIRETLYYGRKELL